MELHRREWKQKKIYYETAPVLIHVSAKYKSNRASVRQ